MKNIFFSIRFTIKLRFSPPEEVKGIKYCFTRHVKIPVIKNNKHSLFIPDLKLNSIENLILSLYLLCFQKLAKWQQQETVQNILNHWKIVFTICFETSFPWRWSRPRPCPVTVRLPWPPVSRHSRQLRIGRHPGNISALSPPRISLQRKVSFRSWLSVYKSSVNHLVPICSDCVVTLGAVSSPGISQDPVWYQVINVWQQKPQNEHGDSYTTPTTLRNFVSMDSL